MPWGPLLLREVIGSVVARLRREVEKSIAEPLPPEGVALTHQQVEHIQAQIRAATSHGVVRGVQPVREIKMAKYTSKGGLSVEAHVVSKDEAPVRVSTAKGQEHANAGDAILTLKDQTSVLPAALFAALFEGEPGKGDKSKGGQQASETQG